MASLQQRVLHRGDGAVLCTSSRYISVLGLHINGLFWECVPWLSPYTPEWRLGFSLEFRFHFAASSLFSFSSSIWLVWIGVYADLHFVSAFSTARIVCPSRDPSSSWKLGQTYEHAPMESATGSQRLSMWRLKGNFILQDSGRFFEIIATIRVAFVFGGHMTNGHTGTFIGTEEFVSSCLLNTVLFPVPQCSLFRPFLVFGHVWRHIWTCLAYAV